MELLKLSKLKLQLQALVAEVRDLRDRERSATEQHHLLFQKLKQNEEECGRKIQELQGELASVREERQKLERKVNYIENDNVLLENKQKELKGTLNNLLQSRESFVHAYEESTSKMKLSNEAKDRMLSVLSEKISSCLALFDSIAKEVFCIKQVLDKVQNIVNDREEVVTNLKNKMDWVSAFEKTFVENISDLRNKVENNEAELRRKDRIISELEAKLDVAKVGNHNQAQMEDISISLHIQKTLSAKDTEIQNLVSDKEVLHYEVGSLRLILQRIEGTITNMNEEDKRLFSSILQQKEEIAMDMKIVDNMMEDVQNNKDRAQEPT
ncbi:hypothetical protein VNO80_09999 [Phaseolus coccineus]|uniref:Uncharacterized protein n=1 Tax=Phaseolus coccineus TaxID=3886 RepID=A0AAN9NCL7_PHACN